MTKSPKTMKINQLREQTNSSFLYHGTAVWFLARIVIADNALYEGAHWGRPGEPHGPRLTRSLQIAKGFIDYAAPDWPIGGVLALDGNRLAQDYKLVDWRDVDVTGEPWDANEEEVVAITDAIQPLSKYLVRIFCDKRDIIEGMSNEALEFVTQEYEYMPDIQTGRRLLQGLLQHPKRSELGNK